MHPSPRTQRPDSAESVDGLASEDEDDRAPAILIAEDEPAVRSLFARALRLRGYRVLEAANGAEAVVLAESQGQPFHLLLTDVVMPKLSGPELAASLLGRGLARRVIYMTGYSDLPLTVDERSTVLHKPFSLTVLTDAVRAALAH
jgi:two-component system, cell cycle sensor histidine kinase and response regulator CckA